MWSKVAENLGVRHAKRLMAFGSFKRSARQPNELDIPTSGDPASESAADASMAKPPPVPVPDPVPASPAVTGAVGPTFTEVEPQVTGDPVTGDSEDIPLASPVFEGFTSASAVIAGDVAPEVSILAVVAEAVVAGGVIPEVAIPTEVVKVAPQPQAEPRALIPFTPIVMDDGRVKQMAKDADAKMAEGMRLPVESRALYQSLAAEADQKPQSLARVLPQIQRIEAQEARIAELERLLGTATRQHQSETASLQEEIITLQGSLNVLSTAVSRLEKELAVAKQEKATATRQVYSLERELELLKLDKEESDSARARAEKRAGDSDSQIEALRLEAQNKQDALECDLKRVQNDFLKLGQAAAELAKELLPETEAESDPERVLSKVNDALSGLDAYIARLSAGGCAHGMTLLKSHYPKIDLSVIEDGLAATTTSDQATAIFNEAVPIARRVFENSGD